MKCLQKIARKANQVMFSNTYSYDTKLCAYNYFVGIVTVGQNPGQMIEGLFTFSKRIGQIIIEQGGS